MRLRPIFGICVTLALFVGGLRAMGAAWSLVVLLVIMVAVLTAVLNRLYRGMYDEDDDF
ncbi:hypothetical protein [Bordetella genomosp. 5]|uniref:hypothetical protein n=1 Tax=Bordetella genomosp. 5 TaxID=1395608 RepID=UPI00148360B6|nr:hypothetical protein [Bordetella genomosp. 5]